MTSLKEARLETLAGHHSLDPSTLWVPYLRPTGLCGNVISIHSHIPEWASEFGYCCWGGGLVICASGQSVNARWSYVVAILVRVGMGLCGRGRGLIVCLGVEKRVVGRKVLFREGVEGLCVLETR